MIIKDPGFLRYDPGLKDQVPKIDIPEKPEPVFIKEKLERIAKENPNDPYIHEYLDKAVSVEISDEGKLLSEKDSTLHGTYKQAGSHKGLLAVCFWMPSRIYGIVF